MERSQKDARASLHVSSSWAPTCRRWRNLLAPALGAAATLLYSTPGLAQPPGAHTAVATHWVQLTILSVAGVMGLWSMLASTLWLARRLRWLASWRLNQLNRLLQVGMGAMLLMAALVPYLAAYHPVLAIGFPTLATFMALVFGWRIPHVPDKHPGY